MKTNNSWFMWMVATIVIAILLVIVMFWYLIFSIKVPVGYVGIKVNMYWDGKWVSIYTLKTWRNWYNPITSDVFKYPTFIQQKEYGEVKFQDTDWLSIWANIWMDYKFEEAKISKIFEEYRASADKITNEYMATWLKNAINRASAWFKVDELYWPKKEEFRLKVLSNIQKDFEEKWVMVNNVYFVWDMQLPEQVMWRINAKIEATQTAMQKENELRAVEAEAQKQIAEAKWAAEARIVKANWEAEAIIVQSKAEAEAIKIKTQAIISQGWADYIQLQAIEKWNGTLPTYTLGTNTLPFINIK